MGWFYLALASLFEVGFTTSLRLSHNFKNVPAVAGFLVCVAGSLLFLELAERAIPLGTAYAIWTGIGAVGTVAIVWFGEPASPVRGLLIAGIIACAIGLKLTAGQ
ncbi:multidrug transporter [Gemmatimonadetes bacterium T265]|nr:multidrug transporter [Gemmatimonadetes bacterium T265]